MSIRPADMQIVVHKTQDIHPAKQSVINKQDHELVHAQQQNKLNNTRNNQRVIATERSELKKVKNDEQSKSSKDKKKKKKNLNKEESLNEKLECCGTQFDMKV